MDTPDLHPHKPHVPRREDGADAAVPARDGQDVAATIGNAGVGRVLNSPSVQRSGGRRMGLDESVARLIEERRGGGAPLSDPVRHDMEGSFGHDFSDVRVHSDAGADALSRSVEARAFTVGSDIFFRQGTYDTASSDGRRLLAHELTHVVQQSGSGGGAPTTVSDPGDASERQADAVAETVVSGGANDGPVGARQEDEEELLQASPEMARQAEEEEEMLQASPEMARQAEEEEEMLQASPEVARQADEDLEES